MPNIHALFTVAVVDGFDVVKKIEGSRTGFQDKPVDPILVAESGEL